MIKSQLCDVKFILSSDAQSGLFTLFHVRESNSPDIAEVHLCGLHENPQARDWFYTKNGDKHVRVSTCSGLHDVHLLLCFVWAREPVRESRSPLDKTFPGGLVESSERSRIPRHHWSRLCELKELRLSSALAFMSAFFALYWTYFCILRHIDYAQSVV